MAKKQQEKKKVNRSKKAKLIDVSQVDHSKPYDFGGIPDRELKKNLGC